LFSDEISLDDVITYFIMTDLDLAQIPEKSAGYNRLGFAFQLSTLRTSGSIGTESFGFNF